MTTDLPATPENHSNVTTVTTVAVPGGSLRVRVTESDGAAVPVLFVHPALLNGHAWDEVVARTSGIRALQPDLPLGGHHLAMDDDADLTFPALATMLLAVLDHFEIERAVVVGNDTGGAITQQFVADHPDRVAGVLLLSCEAFEHFPPPHFEWLPRALQLPGATWITAQALRFAPLRRLPITFGRVMRRRLDRVEAERLMGPLWRLRSARRDLKKVAAGLTPGLTVDLARRLEGFDRPVVIAWSADDPIFPPADAERLAALFPAARVRTPIVDSLAISCLDQPSEVGFALSELLALVPPGR